MNLPQKRYFSQVAKASNRVFWTVLWYFHIQPPYIFVNKFTEVWSQRYASFAEPAFNYISGDVVIVFFEGIENFKLYFWARLFDQFFDNVEGTTWSRWTCLVVSCSRPSENDCLILFSVVAKRFASWGMVISSFTKILEDLWKSIRVMHWKSYLDIESSIWLLLN